MLFGGVSAVWLIAVLRSGIRLFRLRLLRLKSVQLLLDQTDNKFSLFELGVLGKIILYPLKNSSDT